MRKEDFLLGRFFMITREWIESEIEKLKRELSGANSRLADAVYSLGRATAEYDSAKESSENIFWCIRGLEEELVLMDFQEGVKK
jgi:hypothetical protein